MLSRRSRAITADEAERLALQGLTFLAADPQKLARFFALTGLSPAELRSWAEAPHLQAAVLEHLLADESLLMVFAADAGIAPDALAPAHALLAKAGETP